MMKAENLLHWILGPVRSDTRPMALAIDRMVQLLYEERRPEADIRVTADVYAYVGRQLNRSEKAVAKSVERLTALCWDAMDEPMRGKIIGRRLRYRPTPRELLIYFAYYLHARRAYCAYRKPHQPVH